ncbi:class I SAM-dependent methyltransferase [Methylobacterium sp. WL103]|uniref:class I SAM-dependent methyltransferase n=1 Tax=Methylobacterium sp. WL103 TaxID=2603891 RepID=UPI00164FE116|nr:class I SAM-dependent methyltransferase [Methylobacterium sp. WL103]
MSAWTEGYVADIPYALGFYRETVPAHIAFAALSVGKNPGLSMAPKRVLELGIGMGLGFVINAASNPSTQFEGVDFNPLHIAHARGLAEAADIANVSLREASFQDLAREATEGQHDLELIVLHGILTWVSAEAHDAIVEIARKRLKPGGLLYVSYNCMPGWAAVLPLQRLMRENAKRISGRSDVQTGAGLDLVQALIKEGAGYFAANPSIAQRVERLMPMDRNYLAHEYLNANWFIFHFADVAAMFGRAKLEFVGSATIAENMNALCLPQGMRSRVDAEADPVFKETLRDIAANKQFRRDLFGRGVSSTTSAEQNALLGATRFALAGPRGKLTFKFPTIMGELEGQAAIYGPIADRLAQGPARFDEIVALPALKAGGPEAAVQAVALLVHGGQVLPLPAQAPDPAPAQRLNRVIAGKVELGRAYSFLAAPTAGSGVQATNIELLLLTALHSGSEESSSALANDLVARMRALNINWLSEGNPVTDSVQAHSRAEAEAHSFLAEKLPLWRQLGIV